MLRRVIVNTSPLFYLHRVKSLDCLQKLYGEIIIPDAVITELAEGSKSGEDVPQVSEYNWVNDCTHNIVY